MRKRFFRLFGRTASMAGMDMNPSTTDTLNLVAIACLTTLLLLITLQ